MACTDQKLIYLLLKFMFSLIFFDLPRNVLHHKVRMTWPTILSRKDVIAVFTYIGFTTILAEIQLITFIGLMV
jgi:hypothetical protein